MKINIIIEGTDEEKGKQIVESLKSSFGIEAKNIKAFILSETRELK